MERKIEIIGALSAVAVLLSSCNQVSKLSGAIPGLSSNSSTSTVTGPTPTPQPTATPPAGTSPTPTPTTTPLPTTTPAATPPPVPTPSGAPLPNLGSCVPDPVEPKLAATATRVKTPGQQMHFTAGLPFRFIADAFDPNDWQCPPGHPPYVCANTFLFFYVDGLSVGSITPDPNNYNLWELRLGSGLSVGTHKIRSGFIAEGTQQVYSPVDVTVIVDPMPNHSGTITLTQDLVLSGSTPLNWTDKTIIGNGHKVTAQPGYTGSVTISNSFVSGLATYDQLGIDVTTTGQVSVTGSIFEATAPVHIVTNGTASVTFTNNEFRANNFVTYTSDNPENTPVLYLQGNTSGAKTMKGNRLGGGILRIEGMNNWQIGGTNAGEGNVMIGTRSVLQLVDSSFAHVVNYYGHHDYRGGLSQGYNLWLEGSSDSELVEHNVFRDGSWPVQNFGGEFRYNMVVNSGHDWWRSAQNNAKIHHSLFIQSTIPDPSYNGGIYSYSTESGLDIHNNTFDGGGQYGNFWAPAIVIAGTGVYKSIRNNVFTLFSAIPQEYGGINFGGAIIGGGNSPRVTSADYNAFYNPGSGDINYMSGLVQGTAGAHDVQASPQFLGSQDLPYRIPEGCIWSGTYTTGKVLNYYRGIYTPASTSPLINKADPNDGGDIGAIGAVPGNINDLFGLILQ